VTASPVALVSIVIPCHNQGRYLHVSIGSAQGQTHPRVEVIVVDDGSADSTASIGEQCGAMVIRQKNSGVSVARNRGLEAAGGEYVVFLDADDELLPTAVETGLSVLSQAPDALCAVGRTSAMDAGGADVPSVPPRAIVRELYPEWLSENFVPTPGAALFRRAPLQATGGFERGAGPAADYALYLRLARNRQVVDHGRVVVRYRIHDHSMSRDAVLMLRATMRVLRAEGLFVGREHTAAFRNGRARWAQFYGEQILEQLRQEWRAGGSVRAQLRMLTALIRHCPDFLVRRLITRTARALPARRADRRR
jgi:glycosyltransferase involved in cell wall biosynthesis